MKDIKNLLKKTWKFIWYDDSLLSWVVNIILAFVIVKFLIYPGLGLLLGTSYPVVAVVSGSMEHQGFNFDTWWKMNENLYTQYGITKENFYNYNFRNGFNKGDLMILTSPNNFKKGDVIVFRGYNGEPIIHRAVVVDEKDGKLTVQTKGDNNKGSRQDEFGITKEKIIGVARFRIPYLGWFKLAFLQLIGKA